MSPPLMNLSELALSLQRSLVPQGLDFATVGVEYELTVLLERALFLLGSVSSSTDIAGTRFSGQDLL